MFGIALFTLKLQSKNNDIMNGISTFIKRIFFLILFTIPYRCFSSRRKIIFYTFGTIIAFIHNTDMSCLEVVYRGLAIVGVVYLPLHVVAEGKGHDKCKNGPVCHKLSAFINRVDVCAARIVQTERNKACFNCRCAAYRGQRYGKIRHSVCLRAFFLFEVYYCPMLFSRNLINVRKTLSFRYFTFQKK